MVHGSWLMVYGPCHCHGHGHVHGSWFKVLDMVMVMVHGSWFMVHGSWFMVKAVNETRDR